MGLRLFSAVFGLVLTACDRDGDGYSPADGDCDDSDATAWAALDEDPECDGFYLHTDGVTVRCPGVAVGDTGVVGSVTYTRADEDHLRSLPFGDTDCPGCEWDRVCTTGITDLSGLFRSAYTFNQDISGWDTSSVTDMNHMFYNAYDFNQDISGWDTSSVTDMSYMLSDAAAFDQDIGDWSTGSVADMEGMFKSADRFNQDLSGWCVSLITDEPEAFDEGAASWTEPLPVWGTCP